jgi:hypothetical protein
MSTSTSISTYCMPGTGHNPRFFLSLVVLGLTLGPCVPRPYQAPATGITPSLRGLDPQTLPVPTAHRGRREVFRTHHGRPLSV